METYLMLILLLCHRMRFGEASSFEMMSNISINEPKAELSSVMVDKPCKCRGVCFVQPGCIAFAVFREGKEWRCKAFMKTTFPMSTGLQRMALFGFRDGLLTKPEADGFFYVAPDETESSFDNARQKCQTFPGYRLALIKNITSLHIALKYCKNCPFGSPFTVVDMEAFPDGSIRHGDGTPVSDELRSPEYLVQNTPKGNIFLLHGNRLDDHYKIGNYFPLCQGRFPLLVDKIF